MKTTTTRLTSAPGAAALCALLLKAQHTEHKIFRPFNRLFERFTRSYTTTVGFTLKHGWQTFTHIFRGETIKSLLGIESRHRAFERYCVKQKAERRYL